MADGRCRRVGAPAQPSSRRTTPRPPPAPADHIYNRRHLYSSGDREVRRSAHNCRSLKTAKLHFANCDTVWRQAKSRSWERLLFGSATWKVHHLGSKSETSRRSLTPRSVLSSPTTITETFVSFAAIGARHAVLHEPICAAIATFRYEAQHWFAPFRRKQRNSRSSRPMLLFRFRSSLSRMHNLEILEQPTPDVGQSGKTGSAPPARKRQRKHRPPGQKLLSGRQKTLARWRDASASKGPQCSTSRRTKELVRERTLRRHYPACSRGLSPEEAQAALRLSNLERT